MYRSIKTQNRYAFDVSPVTGSWIGMVVPARSTSTVRPALRSTLEVVF